MNPPPLDSVEPGEARRITDISDPPGIIEAFGIEIQGQKILKFKIFNIMTRAH